MDLGLKGKVVVITGAAGLKGSIGETILHKLAEEAHQEAWEESDSAIKAA